MKKHDMTSIRGMLGVCLLWTLLIILLGLLGGADLGHAAKLYIHEDVAAGDDSGDSWTNAKSDIPLDDNDYLKVSRDDTLYFAKGTYSGCKVYQTKLSGGSLPDYVVFKRATVADHGTATGWDNAYADSQAVFLSRVQVTLSNFTMDGVVGSGTSGHGFKIDRSGSITATQGFYAGGDSGITISHTEIEMGGADIEQDVAHDCVYFQSVGADNYTVSYNYLHSATRTAVLHQNVTNCIIEHNYMYNISNTTGIHNEAVSAKCYANANLTLRYNTVKDVGGTGSFVIKDTGTASHCYIYGNIFTGCGPHGNAIFCNTGGDTNTNMHVYNNTIYNCVTSNIVKWYNGTDNLAYNNVSYSCERADVYSGTTHDYNASDEDLGETNDVLVTVNPFTNAAGGNFAPDSTSALKDVANTGVTADPYRTDANGTVHDEIGALAYDAAAPPPGTSGSIQNIIADLSVNAPIDTMNTLSAIAESLVVHDGDTLRISMNDDAFKEQFDIDVDDVSIEALSDNVGLPSIEAITAVTGWSDETGGATTDTTAVTADGTWGNSTLGWATNISYNSFPCLTTYTTGARSNAFTYTMQNDYSNLDSIKVMLYVERNRTFTSDLKAQETDSAAQPSDSTTVAAVLANLTAAVVAWDDAPSDDAYMTSPDFKALLTEVESVETLEPGETINIIWSYDDAPSFSWYVRSVEDGAYKPKIIEYTSAGATTGLAYKTMDEPDIVVISGSIATEVADTSDVGSGKYSYLDGKLWVSPSDSAETYTDTINYNLDVTGDDFTADGIVLKYAVLAAVRDSVEGSVITKTVITNTGMAFNDSSVSNYNTIDADSTGRLSGTNNLILNAVVDANHGLTYTAFYNCTGNLTGTGNIELTYDPSLDENYRPDPDSLFAIADNGGRFGAVEYNSIEIMFPNGGEIFVAGDTDTIQVVSAGVDTMIVYRSTNNGTTWTAIDTLAAVADIEWTVPIDSSDQCLFKIAWKDNESVFDLSDAASTFQDSILIVVPDGGESYSIGNTLPITWTYSSGSDSVKIEYSLDDGSTWTTIVETTASDGSYSWTINSAVSDSAKVRVTDVP